jgi:hypothetical protein
MARRPPSRETDDLVAHYDQHQGDLSLWHSKPRKIRARRGGPSHTFSVRLAPEELESLQKAADERGVTITELVRSAALLSAQEGEDGALREVKARAIQLAEAVKRLA